MPENFIKTTMLYLEMELNKVKFQAFVDTGCENTVISKDFAEKCGLMRDLDTNFASMAIGVGTSKILGRIHTAMLKVGDKHFIQCSLDVIESANLEFLFGLNMMKKHRVRPIYAGSNRSLQSLNEISSRKF